MSAGRVSGALLEKLGEPATAALMEMVDARQEASTEAAMIQCGERFERRLIEETSQLRLETSQLRGDMREGFADLRRDIAAERFELLKWAVALWVGQLAAVAGIVAALLKTLPPR